MQRIIGYLKESDQKLFAQDVEGKLRPVELGDAIYFGETIVDASGKFVPDALQPVRKEVSEYHHESSEEEAAPSDEKKPASHTQNSESKTHTSADHIDHEPGEELWINVEAGLPVYDLNGMEYIGGSKYRTPFADQNGDARHPDYPEPPVPPNPPGPIPPVPPEPPVPPVPPTPPEPPTPPSPEPVPPTPPPGPGPTPPPGPGPSPRPTPPEPDHKPLARPDENEIREGDRSVLGNILDNDDKGDAPAIVDHYIYTDRSGIGQRAAVGVETTTEYGKITIYANGGYRYLLNNNDPRVEALNIGDTLTERFDYTIIDRDGDRSSSTLSIKIDGSNDAPIAIDHSDTYHEDPIDNGNVPGTSNLLGGASDVDDPISSLFIGEVNADSANVGQAVAVNFSYVDKDGNIVDDSVDVSPL